MCCFRYGICCFREDIDGFFQKNLNLWDIAAGIIIIKEAGGTMNKIDFSIMKI